MVEERDIVAISIPYSLGVALAAFMPVAGTAAYLAAAVGLALCAGCTVIFCRLQSGFGAVCIALFAAGIFSACSASLGQAAAGGEWRPGSGALEALLSTIDSAGFSGEQTAALAKALLTGQRTELSSSTVASFRAAGAAHILALSGLHLGVIYGILHKSLVWAGRSRPAELACSILILAVAGFYVLMTGSSASVVRAYLFICLNELSRLLPGRRRRPLCVFAAALTVQLCINPLIIRSAGFQLSYLAMLGIYLLFPKLDAWFPGSRLNPLRRIWSASALTISCQIFTAPVVWWHFRSFPLYFLLTNLVALPLTEAFIICSVAVTTTTTAGCCPSPLIYLTDLCGNTLIGFLEAVASIS
jgi:ComEC/Rec2-related protein